jgi:hypothetical protein
MKTLRAIHLYLGCIFSPMLLFFAVSGIWQTFRLIWPGYGQTNTMTLLSTIHTGAQLKFGDPATLSSLYLKWFVVAMSICFIGTIVLGIVMAFRFGHRKTATACLIGGVVAPALLIVLALMK